MIEFKKLNENWNADPNVPLPHMSIHERDMLLTFRLNSFQFKNVRHGDIGVLRFFECARYRLGATNDEGWYLGQCRFSRIAPAWGEFYEVTGDLLLDESPDDWVALAPPSASTRHFLFYFRDETFECQADDWTLTIVPTNKHGVGAWPMTQDILSRANHLDGHDAFQNPLAIAARMRGLPAPWFISGGWAIDLFLEKVTRDHADIEIGIFREDLPRLREHFPTDVFEKSAETPTGKAWLLLPKGEDVPATAHQLRLLGWTNESETLDIFLNERISTHWRYRRDPRITCPLTDAILYSPSEIPFLAPEIQLLFKAKEWRAKDQTDLDNTLPSLSIRQKVWLATALTLCHPGHPWLKQLT